MRHNVAGRKLKRTKSHRDALLKNLATSLFEHKKLHTTEAKAKELRPYAEALITKAKRALANEKQNRLPDGQTVDIHSRRIVGRHIRSKAVLQELFDAIAPAVETRNGGYTRITKTGTRYGDGGRTALIELVDWSAPVDGAISLKTKRKNKKTAAPKKPKTPKATTTNAEVVLEAPVASETLETAKVEAPVEVVDAPIETAPAAVEAPAEEVVEAPAASETLETAEAEAPVEVVDTPAEDKPENI
jgi:large subunit ribosomal protein L17